MFLTYTIQGRNQSRLNIKLKGGLSLDIELKAMEVWIVIHVFVIFMIGEGFCVKECGQNKEEGELANINLVKLIARRFVHHLVAWLINNKRGLLSHSKPRPILFFNDKICLNQ